MHFVSTFERTKPYNDLPLLPPAARLETEPVLKAAIRASRSLAELKGRTRTVPNPAILLNTIALQEARASSEIENIFTTTDELYRSLNAESAEISPHAKEVLHYNEALWFGAERLRESRALTADLAIELVKMLKTDIEGVRGHPGANLMNRATGEVVYTPPDGAKRLRSLLANLEQFINTAEDGLDPLVKLAVLHYQFEAIHPFADGNGRVSRAIADLALARADGSAQRFYSMSARIEAEKKHYYRALEQAQKGSLDITAWLVWFLGCLDRAFQDAETVLGRIIHKANAWNAINRTPNLNDRQRLVINTLLDNAESALSTSRYAKLAHCSLDTALRDIRLLLDAGVLAPSQAGGRSTQYLLKSAAPT